MTTNDVHNFARPDEVRAFAGHGHADIVMLGDRAVARMTLEPGWTWHGDIKPIVGGDLCQISHLGYCLEGHVRVTMADGTEHDMGPGDVMAIEPGHDAAVIGEEGAVLLDFGELAEYAKQG